MEFGKVRNFKLDPMGTPLYLKFEEIFWKKSLWYYYQNTLMDDFRNLDSVFQDPKEFIRLYLEISKKELPDNLKDYLNNKENIRRMSHTVSTFFLGLLLYEEMGSIKCYLNHYLNKLERMIYESDTEQEYIELPFSYYWFLMCFYHDFGYFIVKKNDGGIDIFGETNWRDIKIEGKELLDELLPLGVDIPTFIVESCKEYLDYSSERFRDKESDEHLDHGTISGLIYYTERKKRNQELFNQPDNIGKTSCITHDGRVPLHWSKFLYEIVHSSISWNIISHNFWFKKSTNGEIYKNRLNSLITDVPLVKIKDYPMYFFMTLIDTIDPVKILTKDDDPDIEDKTLEILKNVGFMKDSSTLFQLDLTSKYSFDNYYQGMRGNDYWLGITDLGDRVNQTVKISISL